MARPLDAIAVIADSMLKQSKRVISSWVVPREQLEKPRKLARNLIVSTTSERNRPMIDAANAATISAEQASTAALIARILVADDDDLFRAWLITYLSSLGYHCDEATDTRSAAEALEKNDPYDLFISDICMPGNSQLEFVQELNSRHPNLPIILVTGQPSVKTATDSMQLRVAAYLVKPFEPSSLNGHVKQALLTKRLQDNINKTRGRINEWLANINDIESLTELSKRRYEAAVPVDAYITLTLQNIVDPLLDLVHLAQGLVAEQNSGPSTENVCKLFKCPRVDSFRKAIVETTDVLEQTKKSFKSKTLADLRTKLERYLSITS